MVDQYRFQGVEWIFKEKNKLDNWAKFLNMTGLWLYNQSSAGSYLRRFEGFSYLQMVRSVWGMSKWHMAFQKLDGLLSTKKVQVTWTFNSQQTWKTA